MNTRPTDLWRRWLMAGWTFLLPSFPETPSHLTSKEVLLLSRERLVRVILRVCTLFGLPAVLFGIPILAADARWWPLIVGVTALVLFAWLAFKNNLPYRIGALVLVAGAYLFLLSWLLSGLDEFFFAALFAFVIMSTFLLGRWGGVVGFLLSLVTILGANWLLDSGRLTVDLVLAAFDRPLLRVIQPYVDWMFYVGLVVITLFVLLGDFDIAWRRERAAVLQIEAERDQLQRAFDREQALLVKLQQAYSRETELSQLRSQIISTVSHEFRTPLAIISNSADLLIQHREKLTPDKSDQINRRLHDAIDYMTDLLQEVETVDTATAGVTVRPVTITMADLGERLQMAIRQAYGERPRLQLDFDREDRHPLRLDEGLLRQVIHSLLANALKYSGPENPVAVELRRTEGTLVAAVRDEGIGLLPEEVARLFDLFYRGSNVETRRGLGLGLYIARTLVEAMGGTLAAESAGPGLGSTFTVSLPLV